MLTISKVETFYGNIQALRGVNVKVNNGEIVALIGSNGAGKSTLLMTISGVNKAAAGEIVFDNIDDCLLRKKEIVSLLEDLFKNADLNDFGKRKHVLDNSGESVTYDVYFWFDDDSVIAVSCYDWTEKAVKELNTIDKIGRASCRERV